MYGSSKGEGAGVDGLQVHSLNASMPLDLHEQVVYTNGHASVFLAAAHRIFGGVPTLLLSKEPRLLERHGAPLDTSIVITGFLAMPEGDGIDAEGRRPIRGGMGLLNAFGVKRGYQHELRPASLDEAGWAQVWADLGAPEPALVDALETRLRNLGWAAGAPMSTGALSQKGVFSSAAVEAQRWWEGWVASVHLSRAIAACDTATAARPRM